MAMNSIQPIKCYIYTRVSTAMQVDGFSLDAQRDRLQAYAKAQGMVIAGEYHIVKQTNYMPHDGIHEAIISQTNWELAQEKRPDGSLYKDYFFYACKHRLEVDGHRCNYRKQWNQTIADDAVAELIRSLVGNPKFENAIRAKINSKVDTAELQAELDSLRKQLRQLNGAADKLGQEMDALDVTDRHYDRKRFDMQRRMESLYDQIDETEAQIDEMQTRIRNINQQRISGERVYQYLQCFDKLYEQFTDAEKKEFVNCFVERVDIYPDRLPNGRFLKHINSAFLCTFRDRWWTKAVGTKRVTLRPVKSWYREAAR